MNRSDLENVGAKAQKNPLFTRWQTCGAEEWGRHPVGADTAPSLVSFGEGNLGGGGGGQHMPRTSRVARNLSVPRCEAELPKVRGD